MERETGIEPAAPTLARLCSTTELFPQKLSYPKVVRKRGLEPPCLAALDPKTNTLSSNGRTPTVASVVRALQRLGASPESVISILETLKRSGAIAADIEVL